MEIQCIPLQDIGARGSWSKSEMNLASPLLLLLLLLLLVFKEPAIQVANWYFSILPDSCQHPLQVLCNEPIINRVCPIQKQDRIRRKFNQANQANHHEHNAFNGVFFEAGRTKTSGAYEHNDEQRQAKDHKHPDQNFLWRGVGNIVPKR